MAFGKAEAGKQLQLMRSVPGDRRRIPAGHDPQLKLVPASSRLAFW
jgi:hypothetical protein